MPRRRQVPGSAKPRQAPLPSGRLPSREPLPLGSLRLLVDDLVLALLDDLVVGCRSAVTAGGSLLGLRSRLGVDRLGELVRGLLQRLRLRLDVADVVALERLAQLHDPALDRRGLGLVELVAV